MNLVEAADTLVCSPQTGHKTPIMPRDYLETISSTIMKITYLDSLRGLAALIVVLSHFAGAFYPFSLFGTTYKQISLIEPLFNQSPLGLLIAGNFAVCLFFILSGYVLSYKFIGRAKTKIRIISAIVKRPIRLGGVVVFTIILSYILMRSSFYYNQEVALLTNSIPWFKSYWGTVPPLKTFLVDLIVRPFSRGLVYNPPLWTISTELYGSYLIFAYLFFVGNARYRVVALALLMYFFRHSFYLCFLLGTFCAEVEKVIKTKNLKISNYLLLGMLPVGLFFGSYPHYVDFVTRYNTVYGWLPLRFNSLGNGGYSMIGALIVFVCVLFCNPLQIMLNKRILRYFGRISYALYALHFIFLGSIASFLYCILVDRIGHNSAFSYVFVVSIPLLILCANLVEQLVDTYSIRFSRWIGNLCEDFIFAQKFIVKRELDVNQSGKNL